MPYSGLRWYGDRCWWTDSRERSLIIIVVALEQATKKIHEEFLRVRYSFFELLADPEVQRVNSFQRREQIELHRCRQVKICIIPTLQIPTKNSRKHEVGHATVRRSKGVRPRRSCGRGGSERRGAPRRQGPTVHPSLLHALSTDRQVARPPGASTSRILIRHEHVHPHCTPPHPGELLIHSC